MSVKQDDSKAYKLVNKLRECIDGYEFVQIMSALNLLMVDILEFPLALRKEKNLTDEEKIDEFFDFFKETTLDTYKELRQKQKLHVKH